MEKLGGVVQSKGGRVVIGATIQVFIAGTNAPATVYADRAGISPITVVKTDNEGEWGCYAPNGRYDVFTTVNGRRDGQYTDCLLYDPADDTDNGSGDGPTNADIAMLSSRIDVANLVLSSLDGRITANNTAIDTRVTTVEEFSESLFGTNATNNIYGIWADNNPAPVSALADEVGAAMIGADGGGSVQSEINALKTNNGANVLSTVLNGLSTATNAVIAATDTVLSAFGKLQAQISGKQNTSERDASGGYVGLTAFAINIKNTAGSIVSKIASIATVARTYTLPDKDGTFAMTSDLSAAGGLVLLSGPTLAGTTNAMSYPGFFNANPSYDKFIVEITNLKSSTASDVLALRLASGGSVDSSTNYSGFNLAGSSITNLQNNGFLNIGSGLSTALASSMTFEFRGVTTNQAYKTIGVRGVAMGAGTSSGHLFLAHEGVWANTAVASGFYFYLTTGSNFGNATIRIYGVKGS